MAGCVSLRSPELVWDVLARGRYDFTYDLMPVSARNMSWAKRLNLFKSGTNVYSAASQLLIGYLYTYYNSVPEQARFFTTINLAVAAEEREFCDRWSHQGRDMAFVPEAVVHHFHTLSLSSFWRQHFDYGRGHPDLAGARDFDVMKRIQLTSRLTERSSFYRGL